MTQEALGMVETRGLVAAIEASDQMVKAADSNRSWRKRCKQTWRAGSCTCNPETAFRCRKDFTDHLILVAA